MAWQDIGSAPKEVECLVAFTDETMQAYFVTTATQELDGRWFNVGDGLLAPTHWMPLPAQPTSAERG